MEKRFWDFNLKDEKDYSRFVRDYHNLRGAPYEIRNNKGILYDCAILNYNAFKYASSALRSEICSSVKIILPISFCFLITNNVVLSFSV